jgi:hypothetical protein
LGLIKYKLALNDFQTVVNMSPKDKDALSKRDECKKAFHTEMFLKAIESYVTRSKPPAS